MSHSKISQVSTKSASKQGMTQKRDKKKDFMISTEFLSGKSDLSFDFNQSSNNQDSFYLKELGTKEQNLLNELEALDVSIIPNDSKSISTIKASYICEDQNKPLNDNATLKPKILLLENSVIKQKWWCAYCIVSEEKPKNICEIV
jgi:hypothetical protein